MRGGRGERSGATLRRSPAFLQSHDVLTNTSIQIQSILINVLEYPTMISVLGDKEVMHEVRRSSHWAVQRLSICMHAKQASTAVHL